MFNRHTLDELKAVAEAANIEVLSPEYVNNSTKLDFHCKTCGNEWKTKPALIFRGQGCRKCAVKRRKETFLRLHGVEGAHVLSLRVRSKAAKLGPAADSLFGILFVTDGYIKTAQLRPDFLVKVVDLANTPENWKLIFKERKAIEAEGKRVLYFYSREWADKRDICEQIIKTNLGEHTKRIPARKCTIEVRHCGEFFDKYHLMGNLKSAKYVCLVHEGEIVCAMSYRKKEEGVDISRFACVADTIVQGGFTKLLKWVEEQTKPAFVLNFVDRRYGTGLHLLNKGFVCERDNEGFNWTDKNGILINRLRCRANMDDRGLTEKQHADELGYWRVYDAGQAKYIKYLTEKEA